MADEQQLKILKQGVAAWNNWRHEHRDVVVDLRRTDLSGADLYSAKLDEANLGRTDLTGANLQWAGLFGSALNGANLSDANLEEATLYAANLTGAVLRRAFLGMARLQETIFGDIDLTESYALIGCSHHGPCIVDHRTLARSKNVPIHFWRGCGLADWQIEAAKLSQQGLTQDDVISITYEVARLRGEQPIQLFSPFISYSSKDDAFARHLYDSLQDKGVRCWFAPEDIKIGDRIRRRVDEVIHVHDKLLLILSEHSVSSQWVEQEVETALEKERETDETVLFPIKVDDAVEATKTGWPALVRKTRHIGDFTNWQDAAAFQTALDRVLRDLRADPKAGSPAA